MMTPCLHSLLAAIAVALIAADTAWAQPRYGALLGDGSWIVGTELQGDPWDATAKIDNRRLFDPANPIRALSDELRRCWPAEDFLAMANGDVLPGQVRGFLRGDPQLRLPDRLLVGLGPPLRPAKEDGFVVQADRVLRIFRGKQPPADSPPGTIRFADGRRAIARSIRFSEAGVRGLTDEGIIEGGYGEIVELHVPGVDVMAAVVDDLRFPSLAEAAGIVRLQTVDGAVLTYRRTMTHVASVHPTADKKSRRNNELAVRCLFVRPAWAVGTVLVPVESICRLGFRADNEVPLSVLPARVVREKHGVHHWPWRRDRSVTGGDLRSGPITAAWGLGTHSHSEIAFELPPGARRFYTLVGLDAAVGDGGCVRVGAFRDRAEGEPLFVSGVLTGADEPLDIGPLDIAGAKTLILVTAMAHAERPAGADPLDIRDQVNWLMPTVTVEPPPDDPSDPLGRFVPGWRPWQLDEASADRFSVSPRWDESYGRWLPAIRITRPEGIALERTVSEVTCAGDLFELNAAPIEALDRARIELRANGQLLEPIVRRYVSAVYEKWVETRHEYLAKRAPFDKGMLLRWDLQAFHGRSVKLELTIAPGREPLEIEWRECRFRSAIANLPADGWPRKPDVPLASLKPLDVQSDKPLMEPRPNALPLGKTRQEPLRFLGQEFTGGYGMRTGSRITFAVEPSYQRFVAVVGCSHIQAGPFRIHCDDREAWVGPVMDEDSPAVQIDVEIPTGTTRLTIEAERGGSSAGYAAFAHAGFVIE